MGFTGIPRSKRTEFMSDDDTRAGALLSKRTEFGSDGTAKDSGACRTWV